VVGNELKGETSAPCRRAAETPRRGEEMIFVFLREANLRSAPTRPLASRLNPIPTMALDLTPGAVSAKGVVIRQ
jgi:hypothetical protein